MCVSDRRDLPSGRGLEQIEGVDSAVAEFSIEVEVVLGPDNRNRLVLQDLRIPDPLEPRVFACAQMFKPFLIWDRDSRAVGLNGEK